MTSETVQAAQRLLAEREAVGLKKYGTTVDRTDLQAGDWLQHAIEEASDLLLYLIRLRQTLQTPPAAATEDAEDAERAAYLARWKDAPEWAEWLSEGADGACAWRAEKPSLRNFLFYQKSSRWEGGFMYRGAGHNLLGSVRCEPRPVLGMGE